MKITIVEIRYIREHVLYQKEEALFAEKGRPTAPLSW